MTAHDYYLKLAEDEARYGSPREDFSAVCAMNGISPEEEESIVKFFMIIRSAEELSRAADRLFR